LRALVPVLLLSTFCATVANGQNTSAVNPAVTPPNVLLLVRQEFQFGKESARQKIELATAQAAARLDVPYTWIDLESLSGRRETILFDPFDSFDHMEQSLAGWRKIYAAHTDLARLQEQIDTLLVSEQSIVAVRRDDVGYLVDHIDLSAARFVRLVEVRLLPGHESDFVEGVKILADAYGKAGMDTPWVVYQVKLGTQSSDFLVFMPMPDLKQNDDLLTSEGDVRNAEGEDSARRLDQIAHESYANTTSNIYAVSPEMSHLAKEPASGDAGSGASSAPAASNEEKPSDAVAPRIVPKSAEDTTKLEPAQKNRKK